MPTKPKAKPKPKATTKLKSILVSASKTKKKKVPSRVSFPKSVVTGTCVFDKDKPPCDVGANKKSSSTEKKIQQLSEMADDLKRQIRGLRLSMSEDVKKCSNKKT